MLIWYIDVVDQHDILDWNDVCDISRIWFLALHEALGMVNAKWGWLKTIFIRSIHYIVIHTRSYKYSRLLCLSLYVIQIMFKVYSDRIRRRSDMIYKNIQDTCHITWEKERNSMIACQCDCDDIFVRNFKSSLQHLTQHYIEVDVTVSDLICTTCF